ncbi:MAG: HAD family phosphatase [Endozoicomonadaceae bacterium]|nr:HAD family phosphatase [Endozoicomonadaceae bacterium]
MSETLPEIKAIILDMDGTLIDTESLYKMSWQQAAQNLGFDISDEDYQQFVGIPFTICLERVKALLPAKTNSETFFKQLVCVQDQLKRALGFPMQPGAHELLTLLQNHSIATALVTSSGKKNIAEYFTGTTFANMFDITVAFEDVTQHKPNPAPYILACQQLNLAPEQTLVIEDSNNGATAAIQAGCHTVIVPGISPLSNEVKARAWGIYSNLHQILTQIIEPVLTNSNH